MKGKKEIRHYTPAEKMAEDYKISQCYICRNDYRSCPYFEAVVDKINDSVSKKSIMLPGKCPGYKTILGVEGDVR